MSERLFLRLDEDPTQGPESEVPPGALCVLAVDAPLREHVSHLLAYRETFAPGHEAVERVLPDGAVRIVFHLGASALGVGGSASALVVGACAAPALVRLRGAMEGLSVTLRPGATQALFGVPAGELEGTAAPLEAFWRSDASTLLEQLSGAADDAARLRMLHGALQCRLRADASPPSALVSHAAALMRRSVGQCNVHAVADALGVGERRLQQLFRAQVGLSPRTFKRLLRLQGLLRTLRRQPARPAWAGVAADGGYYDQAHLANEFRALCGMTPGEFMRRKISSSSKTAA